jgi:hypothetical protein
MAIHWASGTGSLDNYIVFIVEKVVQGWVLVVLMTFDIESCVRCILKTKTKTQEFIVFYSPFIHIVFFFILFPPTITQNIQMKSTISMKVEYHHEIPDQY